jgi:translation initiation factor IF-2
MRHSRRSAPRGAQATDIAFTRCCPLYDGVNAADQRRPSFIGEAAGVPIIVAVIKIDKPDAKPDRVKQHNFGYGP